MPSRCRCTRRKSSRSGPPVDGQAADPGRDRARGRNPHFRLQECGPADSGGMPARGRPGDRGQRAAPAGRDHDDRTAGPHGRVGHRRRKNAHRGGCRQRSPSISRPISSSRPCAPRFSCSVRCSRASAPPTSRCPAAARSARGRSTSTSPACRPWAPTSTSKTATSRRAPGGCKGAHLVLETVTVTGTENLMMAATLADGETVLENAAREPEVVDLANFLIAHGRENPRRRHRQDRDPGRRTSARRELRSAARPHRDRHLPRGGRDHRAVTFASRTRAPTTSMRSSASCRKRGPPSTRGDNWIEVDMRGRRPRSVDIRTAPYPAFPTDMQAQFAALNTVADGVGTIIETIFENRFMHMLEMRRMGAEIRLEGNTAIIKGVERLTAAPVMATDLRASASLDTRGARRRRTHRDRADLSHRSRLRGDRGKAAAVGRENPAHAGLKPRGAAAPQRRSNTPPGRASRSTGRAQSVVAQRPLDDPQLELEGLQAVAALDLTLARRACSVATRLTSSCAFLTGSPPSRVIRSPRRTPADRRGCSE